MTMEGWERPWPSRNCFYNINLRNGEAKYNREKLRVLKEDKALERIYKQNIRKLNAAQRGVISMLGHRPYPNCGREEVLFEYNQPGFCYRRDGQPRIFYSLLESKTRKIVHDLSGKEGLFRKPASNIISDSPVMAEILSSPDIIEILCDLRTTAVLISDPDLFAQFAKSLMSSPDNPLPFHGENPMDCLIHYRNNLIHEFFDAFRIQMEIRRCANASNIPCLNYYLKTLSENNSSGAAATPIRPLNSPMSTKDWNDAVIQRLRETKMEQDKKKKELEKEEDNLLDSFIKKINTKDDLTLSPSNPFNLITPSSLIPPANTTKMLTATETTVNLVPAVPTMDKFTSTLFPHPLPLSQKPKRHEFDRFVKNLIADVEKIAEIGKNMGQLQKRKQQCDKVTNPLVRLLRKKSLFSSLTEDDLLFYEYEGGRRDAERRIARSLNISQPRPGGFTFRVPSRNGDTSICDNEKGTSLSRSRPTTTTSSIQRQSQSQGQNRHQIELTDLKSMAGQSSLLCTESEQCHRSLKRLCCPACNAKLRAKCNEAQERDKKDKLIKELGQWKVAGLSNHWTPLTNSSKDTKAQHLLASIPLALNRNYSRYSTNHLLGFPSTEYDSPYGFTHVNSRGRGVPSPAGPRKPLSSQVTKFMSKFQVSPTGTRNTPKTKGGDSVTGGTLTFRKDSVLGPQKSPANVLESKPDSLETDSWTLKVDRMDITKLRHELETESVREKVSHFQKSFLDIPTNYPL